MLCDCGAPAPHSTIEGWLCGPHYRAAGRPALVSPVVVVVEAPQPKPAVKPEPAPKATPAGRPVGTCRRCARERPMWARDLCRPCYVQASRRGLLDEWGAPIRPGYEGRARREATNA